MSNPGLLWHLTRLAALGESSAIFTGGSTTSGLNLNTLKLVLNFFSQATMPGHVKKSGKQEQDPDPSPWQVPFSYAVEELILLIF